jgi:hypothetical protein
MAHTPGPWHADAIAENGDIRINCEPLPIVIASVHNAASVDDVMFGRFSRVQWDNARLIAAAPDLLAALKSLVPADFAEHPGDFTPDWHAARAAIAKATGEPVQ